MPTKNKKILSFKEIEEETLEQVVLQLNQNGDIYGASHTSTDQEDNILKRLNIELTVDMIRHDGKYGFNLESYLRNIDDPYMTRDAQNDFANYLNRLITQGKSFEIDNRIDGKSAFVGDNGKELHLHIYGSKDIISGNYTIVFVDQTDITKARDNLEIANEELSLRAKFGDYAKQGIHEIKNRLISIGGFASRLLKVDLTDHQRLKEYLKIIHDDERIATRIATDSLDYVNPQKYKKEIVNLNDIVNIVSNSLSECDNGNPELETKLIYNLNHIPNVYADKDKINQCILNLGKNAIEKGTAGNVEISTYTLDNYVVCEVKDDGDLIPQDILERMTELHFTTKKDGSGVGIPIVENIMKKHNGKLIIESEIYEGANRTSLSLYIPISNSINE